MDETDDTAHASGFAQMDEAATKAASAPPEPNDETAPDPGVTADEPDDANPSDAELRHAAIVTRLTNIRAKALQAKRQNMLEHLAEAVAELVSVMLDVAT